jgi:hypothetical protein
MRHLQKGITINGLPIMVKEPSHSTMDIDNLDFYYEDCVIGGLGSFVVSIKDREQFKEAVRTKLILEVEDRMPEHWIVPGTEKEPRVPCLIGEKMWQDRWGGKSAARVERVGTFRAMGVFGYGMPIRRCNFQAATPQSLSGEIMRDCIVFSA